MDLQIMSVDICSPLESMEKDPLGSWRLEFNFLFSNVNKAEKKHRDPLAGITVAEEVKVSFSALWQRAN